MDKKYIAEIIGLLIMILILVIPGIFAIGLLSHEAYHYLQHSEYTQAFCFEINGDTHAFIILNNETQISQMDYELEEWKANRFSQKITWIYTFIALATIIWIIFIITQNIKIKIKNKKIKKRINKKKS